MRGPQLNSMLVPRGPILFMWFPRKQYAGPTWVPPKQYVGPVGPA